VISQEASASRGPRPALKGFLGILTGSAVAQLLAVGAIPLLARLYNPEETARYALLLGVGAVIASFASLRIDLAIPLPKALGDSQRLFWIAALVPLVVAPVIGLGIMLLSATGTWRPPGLDARDLALVAAFVMVLSMFTAASQLGIRVRAYGVLGRIPVLQMVGTLGAQIALGFVGFGRGLFMGGLVGRSFGVAGLIRACGVRPSQIPSTMQAKSLLREYWRFPVIFAPAAAVEVLGSNIAALMLPGLFGLGPAGLYALAARVSAVPGTIIGQSAGQVFLGEFARATSRSRSLRVFFRWSAALATMGVGVTIAVWTLAPLILPTLLGDEWSGTAQLAQWVGVMAGAAIIGSPVQHVWTVRQRALTQFAWNVIRLAVTAGTIWVGAKGGKSITVVASDLALVTALVYALAWVGCLWAAGRPPAGRHHFGETAVPEGAD